MTVDPSTRSRVAALATRPKDAPPIVMLTASSLAVMTNLRSVFIGRDIASDDSFAHELEIVVQMALLTARRGVLFNMALYLTFVSVLLLGIAALRFA